MADGSYHHSNGEYRTYSRRGVLALTGGALAATALTGVSAAGTGTVQVSLDEPLATTSPSSPVAPTDGFADTDWTAEGDLTVVRVTNLDRRGEGSLYHALSRDVEGDGRVVVFEVGGVIDISGEFDPGMANTVIAGQTAPGPGITLIRGTLEIDGPNVLVQHIRSRAGTDTAPGASGEGEAADSIVVGDEAQNVIVDHCTASWGTDESLSCGDTASDVTFSNNMIAHGLAAPGLHPDGEEHSNGTLVGHDTTGMAVLGNLYAHNNDRHPRLKGGTRSVVANNVVYNFDTAVRLGDDAETHPNTLASVVRNVYRPGDNTPRDSPIVAVNVEDDVLPVKVFVDDNVVQGDIPVLPENPSSLLEVVDSPPVWPEGFDPACGTFGQILETASARPAQRTVYDERVVHQTRARTGEVIDSQAEVGGYPDYDPVRRELDVPSEGFGAWFAEYTRAVELESSGRRGGQ